MADDMKRFEGIWNAAPEKRYKHFVANAADRGTVWMLANGEGVAALEIDGYTNFLVWPSQEFAAAFDGEEYPIGIEVHEFCRTCEELVGRTDVRFMVFPTEKNCFIVETEELLNDILDGLELIE